MRYWVENCDFFHAPPEFDTHVSSVIASMFWYGTTRMVWLNDGEEKSDDMFSHFNTIPPSDKQMDRQTDCTTHMRRALKTADIMKSSTSADLLPAPATRRSSSQAITTGLLLQTVVLHQFYNHQHMVLSTTVIATNKDVLLPLNHETTSKTLRYGSHSFTCKHTISAITS